MSSIGDLGEAPAGEALGPLARLAAVDDVTAAVKRDPRFAAYKLAAQGDGFVELRIGETGVALLDPAVWRDPRRMEPHLTRASAGRTMLALAGSDEDFAGIEALRDRAAVVLLSLPASPERVLVALRNCVELMELRARSAEQGRWAVRYEYELGELIGIARAISSERDLDTLLGLILEKSRHITGADAGSVYVLEGEGIDVRDKRLHFMLSQNDSMVVNFGRKTLKVDDTSIVGRAVVTREPINIPDLYGLDADNPYGFRHDRTFDLATGYRTRSMLTVPMINQRDEVIGCIQLINKKRTPAARLDSPEAFDREVVPFDERSEQLCLTLASQAGISLENALLYDDIRKLFESFVQASVTAIESRDPTTAGHSQRVATLTVGLAQTLDRVDHGPYKGLHFTEDELDQIRYAGLLHDFGKVGVRENVLVKAKKLYDGERDRVLQRFDYIRKSLQQEASERKLAVALERSRDEFLAAAATADADLAARLRELDEFVTFILKANEPTVLETGGFERLVDIAARRYVDFAGEERPYLTGDEVRALQVPRGSLTNDEREQIESHVVHTYNFLKQIPWGRQFKDIPAIAGAHHEKLDGTGYPRRLQAAEIPVQAKMMTISDIFDALTAQDRPYKKAVPPQRALDIIGFDVKAGKCDPDLFHIFVEAQVYKLVL
jgi:HD-GYP domain-containing protein (c-di-GMP phosphodiesterase class II)